MLESLRQSAGTIHELNLDGAFPERTPYRPRELYEALKATVLFDAEHRQWNSRMTEQQEMLQTGLRSVDTQLLAVLVQAEFDPQGARAAYGTLKATAGYDPDRAQWNQWLPIEPAPREYWHTDRLASTQLLGVLAEAQFDATRAQVLYEKLKGTPLYDPERRQWNDSMTERQLLGAALRRAGPQLLGVLVEAQFNREHARVLYEELKATPLYDPAQRQWNGFMRQEQVLGFSSRMSDAQLLGVLTEALSNPQAAQALYEELQASPLYDPERRQWNAAMSAAQVLQNPDREADVQLLGVLVEAKLLSALRHPLAEAVPPLPIVEAW